MAESLIGSDGKKHSAVSNDWIAKHLEMGHPVGMSKAVKQDQESPWGENLRRKYEKYLNPRSDSI